MGFISAFGNVPAKIRNSNLTCMFATEFSGVTLEEPSSVIGGGAPGNSRHVANGGTIPNYYGYTCDNKITGVDIKTGFSVPSGAPIYANSSIGYGVYLINWYNGFPTNDRAGVDAVAPIKFEKVVIDGVETTALSLTLKAVPDDIYNHAIHVGGYRQQLWYMFYRDVVSGPDLARASINTYVWLNYLNDKYSASKRRTTVLDIKTGSSLNGGDFRLLVVVIYANDLDSAEYGVPVGTIGWEVVLDNDANSSGPVLTKEEFVHFKNYSVPVPQEEWFEINFSWKRGASYADTTSGRCLFKIKIPGETSWTVVADIHAATVAQYELDHPLQCGFPTAGAPHPQRNIHMGERGNKVQRIFLGQYSYRLNTDYTIKFAKFSMWDSFVD